MKAVILAAGEGRRMRPLTEHTPKTLLKIHGRPVLDYVFDALPEAVTEVVLVVRYLKERIRAHAGDEYRGRKIYYAEGSDKGTAYSFLAAKDFLGENERFLVLYGDEFPLLEDVRACLAHPLGTICFEYDKPEKAGVVTLDNDGFIVSIVEKPEKPESNLVVGGIMALDGRIFSYEPIQNAKGEYYLTSMLEQFAKEHKVKAVFTKKFLGDITTPADIRRIESLLEKKKIAERRFTV